MTYFPNETPPFFDDISTMLQINIDLFPKRILCVSMFSNFVWFG